MLQGSESELQHNRNTKGKRHFRSTQKRTNTARAADGHEKSERKQRVVGRWSHRSHIAPVLGKRAGGQTEFKKNQAPTRWLTGLKDLVHKSEAQSSTSGSHSRSDFWKSSSEVHICTSVHTLVIFKKKQLKNKTGRVWWYTPLIPAPSLYTVNFRPARITVRLSQNKTKQTRPPPPPPKKTALGKQPW